jgi:hypothetical protein
VVLALGDGVVVLGLEGGPELDAVLEERAGFADRLECAVQLGWPGAVAVAEQAVVFASPSGSAVKLTDHHVVRAAPCGTRASPAPRTVRISSRSADTRLQRPPFGERLLVATSATNRPRSHRQLRTTDCTEAGCVRAVSHCCRSQSDTQLRSVGRPRPSIDGRTSTR